MERFTRVILYLILLLSTGSLVAQSPVVDAMPPADNFINEEFCFPVTFEESTGPTGYGPYVRIILPPGVNLSNATLLGNPLTITLVGVFAGTPLKDPLHNTGTAADSVLAAAGYSFYIVEYPVGSLTMGGVILEADFCITMDPNVVSLGVPQDIFIEPYYQYGNTPTGSNGPVSGNSQTTQVIPTLYEFQKISNAPNGDQPPGPSWPITYSLVVDIASGMTITNLQFDDVLPPTLQWTGNPITIAGGTGCTVTSSPNLAPTPGGTIQVSCPSATGSLALDDVLVQFEAFIVDTLDESLGDGGTCDAELIPNQSSMDATEGSLLTDGDTVQALNLTLQHQPNLYLNSPGNTVVYLVDFQVSDFITSMDSLVLTLVVADGLDYAGNALLNGNPIVPSSGPFLNTPGPGQTTVTFFISTALGGPLAAGAFGQLTYEATIRSTYASSGNPVLTRDILSNAATLDYHLTDENPALNGCSYSDNADVEMQPVTLLKQVVSPQATYVPGDSVTYLLQMELLSGDADGVIVTDFFPLPVHDVNDLILTWNGPHIQQTSNHDITIAAPVLSIDPATNALIVDFGNLTTASNSILIEFTVTIPITTIPFANGLEHSNFLSGETNNTSVDAEVDLQSTSITVGAPELQLTKGVASSSNPNSSISPAPSFPIDGDLTDGDGADTITFVASIQNIGGATAYDIFFNDTVPNGFSSCALVSVTQGNGTPFPFVPSGSLFSSPTDTLFLDSLLLQGDPTTGDIALITYQCIVDSQIVFEDEITNRASIVWSSAIGQPNVFPPRSETAMVTIASPMVDKNIIAISPGYAGNLNEVQIGEVVTYRVDIVIPEGESQNASIVDTLDEGMAFISLDTLFGSDSISSSNGSFAALQASAIIGPSGPAPDQQDGVLSIDLGTLINVDSNDLSPDTLTLIYSVRILNAAINNNGDVLSNNFAFQWDDPNSAQVALATSSASVQVIEPQVEIVKSFLTNNVLRGDQVFVNLAFTNTDPNATAFDVVISDTLPVGLNFLSGSFNLNCGLSFSNVPSFSGGVVSATLDSLPPGASCDFTFKIVVDSAVPECSTIINCGDAYWESLYNLDQAALGNPPTNTLGVERTGDQNGAGELNNYLSDSCVGLDIINGLATDPVITSNAPVCVGDQVTLQVQQYSGLVVTYNWFGPAGPINNNSFELILNPAAASDSGTYFVIVDVDGCVSDTSQPHVVDVLPLPAVAPVNDGTLCSANGTDLNFTANPSGGTQPYTFIWSGPNSFNTNVENPVIPNVDANASGYYTVEVTDSNGCSSPQTSTLVSVSTQPSIPIIGFNNPVCEGDQVNFSTSNYTGSSVTYTWTGPGVPPTATGPNFTINPVTLGDAGDYTVFVTVDGCASDSSTVATLIVNPLPGSPAPTANAALCAGDSLILTANPAMAGTFTYFWTGPNGFTSTQENPVILNANVSHAGSYLLVVSSASGCSSQATLQVTLGGQPSTPAIVGGGSVCVGDPITLTAGSYAGNNVLYIWTLPSGALDTTLIPQLVVNPATAADSGNYSLTVNVDGCISAPSPPVVVAVESSVATPQLPVDFSVCEGDAIVLATTSSADVHSWTGPNGFTSNVQNPAAIQPATMLDAGDYILEITVNGCGSAADTVTVEVNPLPVTPTIVGSSPVCQGDTLFFSTSSVCDSYLWIGPGGNSAATLNNPLLNTTVGNTAIPPLDSAYLAGSWSVVCVSDSGCESAPSLPVTVVINPIPAAPIANNNSPICEGEDLDLLAGTVAGANYLWSGPNGFSSSQQNPTITSANAGLYGGNYFVQVEVNGCWSDSSLATFAEIRPAPIVTVNSDTLLCTFGNFDINLVAIVSGGTGFYTYSWTGPNGFSSSSVSPVVPNATSADAGPYTLVVTDSAGCSSSPATGTLHITDGIVTPVISVPGTLCEGDQLQLTSSVYAGDTVFYHWNTPSGTVTTPNPSLVISAVVLADSGNYSLVVEVDGCISQPSNVINLQIEAVPIDPNPIAIYPSLCAGDTLFLSASGNPSDTYTWIGPNGFNASGQLVFVPNAGPTANGSYTVTVNNGNCTAMGSVTINSIAPYPNTPTIANGGVFCEGDNVVLTTSAYSGATVVYYWQTPSGADTTATASLVLGNLTLADSGLYSVMVEVDGCPSLLSASVLVTVNAIPGIPNINLSGDSLCEGDSLVLTTVTLASTYMWNGPNGFSSSLQNPPQIGPLGLTDAGIYSLAIVENGCTSLVAMDSLLVLSGPAAPAIQGPTAICDGDTLVLTTSASCGQYLWIGPGGNSSSTLSNPLLNTLLGNTAIPPLDSAYLAGDWSVICVDSFGCESAPSAPLNVGINPLPAVPTASNSGPFCEGDQGNLFAAGLAGNYQWTGPNGFSSNAQNPTLFNLAVADSGDYFVSVEVNGCVSPLGMTTVEVNVTPPAPQPTSNGPICSGSVLTLIANASGDTYLWAGPNGFISTQQNPIISNTTTAFSGSYQLTVTLNGCASPSGVVNVNILDAVATPNLTNNSPVCEGEQFILNANSYSGSGVLYIWYGPNGQILDTTFVPQYIDTLSVLSEAGFYQVVVQVNGCNSLPSAFSQVVVNPIPAVPVILSNSPVCEGEDIVLTTSTLTDSYLWTGPDGFLSVLQQPPVVSNGGAVNGGTYYLMVTENGCQSLRDSELVVVTPTPSVPVIFSNSPVCIGDSLVLNTIDTGSDTYTWSLPNGLTTTTLDTFLIIYPATVADSGEYSLVQSLNGCPSPPSLPLTVDVYSVPPDNAYAGEDILACSEVNPISLNASNLFPGIWTTNSAATIISPTDPQTFVVGMLEGQTYTFTWTISNVSCILFSIDSVEVNVATTPIALNDSSGLVEGQTLEDIFPEVNDSTFGIPAGIEIIDGPFHGNLVFGVQGDYQYTPEAGYYGLDSFYYSICLDSCPDQCDTALFRLTIEPDLVIPDLITPNGDGTNDAFVILGMENYPASEIYIYNRWGNEIYHAQPYQNDWEGTRDGSSLPEGTYFFVLLSVEDGRTIARGYITLHR